MRRGLVIGKFLPIHNGHIALIEFAAKQCDELIVSMSYTDEDVIPAALRFSWIKEIFEHNPSIKASMIRDDFDDLHLPLNVRTVQWAKEITKVYPRIDVIISSEEYGEPFALNLGVVHVPFDPERKKIPVSASLIRENPFRYWDYIPRVVRPFFVKKICIYGPESTGKSTLAIKLAERFQTEFVPEVAREFITSNDFTVDDIITIAEAHYGRIQQKLKTANKILICDTDVITTQIYSRHYLNIVPDILYEIETIIKYDKYFLMDIDVAWIEDGLRDLGHRRDYMMKMFRDELVQRGINYITVSGDYAQREEMISDEITRILS